MRAIGIAIVFASLVGCSRPSDPVPLKSFVLHDVQGWSGGHALWVPEDNSVVVQVVGRSPPGQSGLWEKRYEIKVTLEEKAKFERLVGTHDFLHIKIKERPGEPDEPHPIIVVVTKHGTTARAMKPGGDKHADFDPLYGHLLNICHRAEGEKPVWEGPYDWDWRPAGFDRPW